MNLSILFWMYVGCSIGTFITYFWVRAVQCKTFPMRGAALLFFMGPFVFFVLVTALFFMYLVEGIKYASRWLKREWDEDIT